VLFLRGSYVVKFGDILLRDNLAQDIFWETFCRETFCHFYNKRHFVARHFVARHFVARHFVASQFAVVPNVYFGQFFQNYKSSSKFWAIFSRVYIVYEFCQKLDWPIFWTIFSQTHHPEFPGHPGANPTSYNASVVSFYNAIHR
jgi:hypothetical protein